MSFRLHLNRRYRTIAASIVAAVLLTSNEAMVRADDVDTLIAAMDEISHEATSQSEEVKQLEVDIEESQQHLDSLRVEAEGARERAQVAQEAERAFQGQVNDIAGAKYRGTMIDPITNAIAARSPQNAIDRSAYLATLTRNTERAVEKLSDATAEAGKAHTDASRALAEAGFQQSLLEQQKRTLEEQQDELKARVKDIEEKVNGLSPEDRARWMAKNNPLTGLDIASFAGSGAVSAALSKLGSPYGWGASGPNQFDCSGLMYWAYQQQGKSIPRTSQAQLAGGTPVSRAELQPGDIVGYYPGVTHVGMYIGNGQLVHASDYGIPVQVVSVDSMPWAGAARF
ncbi:C40 family peptidase [Corynebacterium atrinae]|uniref:C40 family peptidase n=1 Tax=Corynebacterium atrinae TaxID=1336740 RepID=UPI0025B44D83|nr:C40 family peptidase [Corynebacterium atrinae]